MCITLNEIDSIANHNAVRRAGSAMIKSNIELNKQAKLQKSRVSEATGGALAAQNEVFRKLDSYDFPYIYVSQYDRVIFAPPHRKAHLMAFYHDPKSGYDSIHLHGRIEGLFYKQQLVGEVWNRKPDMDEPVDSHHIYKVKQHSDDSINYAENLFWVPRRYHKMIDSIRTLRVIDSKGKAHTVTEPADIAQMYDISEQAVYEWLYANTRDHNAAGGVTFSGEFQTAGGEPVTITVSIHYWTNGKRKAKTA